MTTLVLIGSSQTLIKGNQLYNRRGYRDKYGPVPQ
jgi:precorrin-3B methylase